MKTEERALKILERIKEGLKNLYPRRIWGDRTEFEWNECKLYAETFKNFYRKERNLAGQLLPFPIEVTFYISRFCWSRAHDWRPTVFDALIFQILYEEGFSSQRIIEELGKNGITGLYLDQYGLLKGLPSQPIKLDLLIEIIKKIIEE